MARPTSRKATVTLRKLVSPFRVTANPVWKTIFHLAKSLGVKLDVVFLWEDKPKAANPGKTARMRYVDEAGRPHSDGGGHSPNQWASSFFSCKFLVAHPPSFHT
jgi:hypothetical protein